MPSGLTHEIYEGTNMSLRAFALKCATQFGIGYRASDYGNKSLPLDKAPVLEMSDYNTKRLEKSKEDLKYWLEVEKDRDLAEKLYNKYLEQKKSDSERHKEISSVKRERYMKMIEKVENWNCGEKLQYLKDYMLKHLNECMDHDCADMSRYYDYPNPSLEEWLDAQIKCSRDAIKIVSESIEKEKDAIQKTNDALQNLYASLDEVEPFDGYVETNRV